MKLSVNEYNNQAMEEIVMYSISVARKVETAPKKKSRQSEGLCATCIHASTCVYNRNSIEPRFFCEEFEANPTPSVNPVLGTTVKPLVEQSKDTSSRKKQAKYEGLCVNCAHRESCTFPKPEGGVWHCEEYS